MSTTLPRPLRSMSMCVHLLRVSGYMVPQQNTTAKKAPTLKDSQFHNNNIPQGIKALQQDQEKGIITHDDAHMIDEYLVKRKAENDLSRGRVTKILWTLLSWRRFVPPFRKNTMIDLYKSIDAVKTGTQKGTGQ